MLLCYGSLFGIYYGMLRFNRSQLAANLAGDSCEI